MPSCFKNKRTDVKKEEIKLDISIGDIILVGRFKNKRIVVKTIGKDDLGQPTINGMSLLKMRIEKLLPPEKQSKETREESEDMKKENVVITKNQLREMIREAVLKEYDIPAPKKMGFGVPKLGKRKYNIDTYNMLEKLVSNKSDLMSAILDFAAFVQSGLYDDDTRREGLALAKTLRNVADRIEFLCQEL